MPPPTTATFGALLATLWAAHQLADYVLGQTDAQAAAKAGPGPAGWWALARHVVAYHAVVTAMVAVTVAVVDLPLTATGATAGLAVSAATHALWDRRTPVRWMLEHTGSAPFAQLAGRGMNGMHLADQALHAGSLWVAALVAVAL